MKHNNYRFYGGPWHGQERAVLDRNIAHGITCYVGTETVSLKGAGAAAKYGSYDLVNGDFIWTDRKEYVSCVPTYNAYGFPQLFENISVFLRGLANLPPEYYVCLQTFNIQADPDTHTLRLRVYVTKVFK